MSALLWLIGLAPVLTGEAAPCTTAPDQIRLQVAVTGLRNGNGMVAVTVYGDNPADFLASGRKLARIRQPARAGVTEVCLAVPPRPAYAIALYHDENGDGAFDRNLIGLPLEGYGFSNDAPATLGIPGFEAARFTAGRGDNRLTIAVRY